MQANTILKLKVLPMPRKLANDQYFTQDQLDLDWVDLNAIADGYYSRNKTPPKETILAYGAGQETDSMLKRFVNDDKFREKYAPGNLRVYVSATGAEHPFTYEAIKQAEKLCKKHDIEFKHITPDLKGKWNGNEVSYHKQSWQSLGDFFTVNNWIAMTSSPRWCTDSLKITPYYNYLGLKLAEDYGLDFGRKKEYEQFHEQHGKPLVLIGFDVNEKHRIALPVKQGKYGYKRWRQQFISMGYPFINEGYTRQDANQYVMDLGYVPVMPSNCVWCPFTTILELVLLYKKYRDYYNAWVGFERKKLDFYADKDVPRNNTVLGKQKTIPEHLEIGLDKYDWSIKDLEYHVHTNGHKVKSCY